MDAKKGIPPKVDSGSKSPFKTLADEQQFPEQLILAQNRLLFSLALPRKVDFCPKTHFKPLADEQQFPEKLFSAQNRL